MHLEGHFSLPSSRYTERRIMSKQTKNKKCCLYTWTRKERKNELTWTMSRTCFERGAHACMVTQYSNKMECSTSPQSVGTTIIPLAFIGSSEWERINKCVLQRFTNSEKKHICFDVWPSIEVHYCVRLFDPLPSAPHPLPRRLQINLLPPSPGPSSRFVPSARPVPPLFYCALDRSRIPYEV